MSYSLKRIALGELNQYEDYVILVHWETGSVMPFEMATVDSEDPNAPDLNEAWQYKDPRDGDTYYLTQDEEVELITSIHVFIPE